MYNQIKVDVYEDVFLPCNFYKSVFNLGMVKCEQNKSREKVFGHIYYYYTDMAFFKMIMVQNTL